ncbi:MAG: hypothetical protein M0Z50_11340 [Planctomycetia bacterium]|nr:hypothetical protein [Planctomycetia bacterium]
MMIKTVILSTGLIAAGMLGTAGMAHADIYLGYQSVSIAVPDNSIGTGDSGYPLNGSLMFGFYNDKVTVTITNTSAPLSAMEAIYGVKFSLQNFIGEPLTINNATTVGNEISIASNGTYTSSGPYSNNDSSSNTLANPWQLSGTGSYYSLEVGSEQPHDLVIGPANSRDDYSSANGSVAGNGSHNPFLASGAVFTLNDTGNAITSLTQLSGDVTVLYGTGPSSAPFTPAPLITVAGTGTLPLLGGGLFGFGLIALHKRRRHCVK